MGFLLGWNNPLILTIDPNFQRDIQVNPPVLTATASWQYMATNPTNEPVSRKQPKLMSVFEDFF